MQRVGSASRNKCFALLLLIATPGCIAPLEFGGQSSGTVAPDQAPDPSYEPAVGDRAVLFGTGADAPSDQVPLLQDLTAFDKYERAIKSANTGDLSDMEQQGWLVRTPNGTRVSVLSLKDRTHVGDRYAVEVRVLDGSFKDKTAWTPASLVTRFIQTGPQE